MMTLQYFEGKAGNCSEMVLGSDRVCLGTAGLDHCGFVVMDRSEGGNHASIIIPPCTRPLVQACLKAPDPLLRKWHVNHIGSSTPCDTRCAGLTLHISVYRSHVTCLAGQVPHAVPLGPDFLLHAKAVDTELRWST